ncbi:Scr1 family TA system antitoxin-like transcriptional regulator [Actinokineospora sp.]|uniref:Scr1 family TA system antitoxin-like transcriptional regulator n=1 Tax=Actinokineospora sp. TaxID=1872133 RepID=UPI004037EAE9
MTEPDDVDPVSESATRAAAGMSPAGADMADTGDEGWRAELVLTGRLSSLNGEIAGYVLRSLDADAGRAAPTSVEDEQALGQRLVEIGHAVIERARNRRAIPGGLDSRGRVVRPRRREVKPAEHWSRSVRNTLRGRVIGLELSAAAHASGQTIRTVAHGLGFPVARIHRLLSGYGLPNPEDVATVGTFLGISRRAREQLCPLAHQAAAINWLEDHGTRLPMRSRTLRAVENGLVAMTCYDHATIPRPLRTPAYHRALLTASPLTPPDEINQRVEALTHDHRLVTDESAACTFLIEHHALTRTGIPTHTMKDQLAALREHADRSNVTIRIIPAHTGHPAMPLP